MTSIFQAVDGLLHCLSALLALGAFAFKVPQSFHVFLGLVTVPLWGELFIRFLSLLALHLVRLALHDSYTSIRLTLLLRLRLISLLRSFLLRLIGLLRLRFSCLGLSCFASTILLDSSGESSEGTFTPTPPSAHL